MAKQLTAKQLGAITYSVKHGKEVQQKYPQIGKDRKAGLTYREIISKYNLRIYSYPEHVLSYALRGNSNGCVGEVYPGSLSTEEIDKITKDCMKARGLEMHIQKKGLFSEEASRKRKEVSKEVRSESGKKGVEARGMKLWNENERESALQLAQQPEYRRGNMVLNSQIAEQINLEHHQGTPIRTGNMVRNLINRLKKN